MAEETSETLGGEHWHASEDQMCSPGLRGGGGRPAVAARAHRTCAPLPHTAPALHACTVMIAQPPILAMQHRASGGVADLRPGRRPSLNNVLESQHKSGG
eukprot:6550257-Pyramimonas_sp.AAC.1